MSLEWTAFLSALTCTIGFIWARAMGERVAVAATYALLLGFIMPWGIGTLFWLVSGGAA